MPANTPKKIIKWLIYIISIILLLGLTIGIISAIRLNQINTNIIELSQDRNTEREILSEIRFRFTLTDTYSEKFLEDYKQGNLLLYQQSFADLTTFIEEKLSFFSASPKAELYREISLTIENYGKAMNNIDETRRAGESKSKEDLIFYTSQLELHKNENSGCACHTYPAG